MMRFSKILSGLLYVAIICDLMMLAGVHFFMADLSDAGHIKTILVSILPFLIVFYYFTLPVASGWSLLVKEYNSSLHYEGLITMRAFLNGIPVRRLMVGAVNDGLILKAQFFFSRSAQTVLIPWIDILSFSEKKIKALLPPVNWLDRDYMQINLFMFPEYKLYLWIKQFCKTKIAELYEEFKKGREREK
ncbi:hypothetical protein JW935_04650 [candidate division KSB1 bacterium]|nr:hypothetical protein [candidate division KSB1 bacterium]